jgi:hypothetical protein
MAASSVTHPVVVRLIHRSAARSRCAANSEVGRQPAGVGKWFGSPLGHEMIMV